jgi:hypothetical protein
LALTLCPLCQMDAAFRDALIQAGYKLPAQHTEL